MSSSTGGLFDSQVYTAFGERITSQFTAPVKRYGFIGAWGYQAPSTTANPPTSDFYPTSFPYLHVGHRYYDPAVGRFLQRDPIGVFEGNNVNAYVNNNPVRAIDPRGTDATEFWHFSTLPNRIGATYQMRLEKV